MRSNNISYLEEDSFVGFGESLKFLWLQKNRIKTIPNMALSDLHSLESLYLQNNDLTHLPHEVIEPVLDSLDVLKLQGNPLFCDCELRWYEEWLETKININYYDEEDRKIDIFQNTTCYLPSEKQEYALKDRPMKKLLCDGNALEERPLENQHCEENILEERLFEKPGSNQALRYSPHHIIFIVVLIITKLV